MDTRPIIVAIEGADGSGKTRHVQAAVESLGRAGYKARAFHHPAPKDPHCLSGQELALWYAARRGDLIGSLSPGDVVVADRWFWSTLAVRAAMLSQMRRPCDDTMEMRCTAEEEADTMGWLRPAVLLDDTLPIVVVNTPAPRAVVRMAAIFLDAPDGVLDDRIAARGEPLWPARHGERAFYRRATCVDTSQETADLVVPRLVRWAVDGLRMGAL